MAQDEVDDGVAAFEARYEAALRRRRWRLWAVWIVLLVALGTGAWVAWDRVWATPSAARICAKIWELGNATDPPAGDPPRGPRALLRSTSEGFADMAAGEALHTQACSAYFDAMRSPLGAREYGELGRCIVHAKDHVEAQACLADRPTHVAHDALRDLIAANGEFPVRRPSLPSHLEPHYDAVLALAERALDECPAIFSPDRGCYVYMFDRDDEQRPELAHAIPSAPGALGPDLLALEASCDYDAATWIERHPQLVEQARAFPLPVQRFACNYLPQGDLPAVNECSSSKPFAPDAHVGARDNEAEISIPYDAECEGRWFRIEVARSRGDGASVTVKAYFRGPNAAVSPTD